MNVGEQQRDDVLADAAPVIRARAGSLSDALRVERDGDLVRLVLRAFTLRPQLQALPQRLDQRAALVITPTALEALLIRQRPNLRFRQFEQLLFRHGLNDSPGYQRVRQIPTLLSASTSFYHDSLAPYQFRKAGHKCRTFYDKRRRRPSYL